MSLPTYTAKKVGDEYVLVRVDLPGRAWRYAAGVAGVALLRSAARSNGLLSVLGLVTGAALTYQSWTGRNVLDVMGRLLSPEKAPSGRAVDSPSYPGQPEHADAQLPTDEIEEASMGSFPASDPPASHRTA